MMPVIIWDEFVKLFPDIAKDVKSYRYGKEKNTIIIRNKDNSQLSFTYTKPSEWDLQTL